MSTIRESTAAEDEELLEQKALGRIVFAFQQYAADAEQDIARWEHNYRQLSARHRTLLHTQPLKFAAARTAVRQNSLFIQALLADFADEEEEEQAAGGEQEQEGPISRVKGALAVAAEMRESQAHTSPVDVDKVRYVLKNLVRDWSAEGALERSQCYGLLVQEVMALFADRDLQEDPPSVLVPGAGLARLCVDLAAAGCAVQGNEFSYFMLVTSSFLLNSMVVPDQWTLHPWAHGNVNHVTDADQLRPVTIPDVVPRDVVRPGLLSMCAGDFVEVYRRPEMAERFDAVVTCFFIDTAHNILEYLEVIHAVLKPGGYWVHLGPLLWHWADSRWEEPSLELSLADVIRTARLMGFDTLQQRFVDAAYIANVRSMYKTVYQAAFWTMVKSSRVLPQDLGQLVQVLAAARQQEAAAAAAAAAASGQADAAAAGSGAQAAPAAPAASTEAPGGGSGAGGQKADGQQAVAGQVTAPAAAEGVSMQLLGQQAGGAAGQQAAPTAAGGLDATSRQNPHTEAVTATDGSNSCLSAAAPTAAAAAAAGNESGPTFQPQAGPWPQKPMPYRQTTQQQPLLKATVASPPPPASSAVKSTAKGACGAPASSCKSTPQPPPPAAAPTSQQQAQQQPPHLVQHGLTQQQPHCHLNPQGPTGQQQQQQQGGPEVPSSVWGDLPAQHLESPIQPSSCGSKGTCHDPWQQQQLLSRSAVREQQQQQRLLCC